MNGELGVSLIDFRGEPVVDGGGWKRGGHVRSNLPLPHWYSNRCDSDAAMVAESTRIWLRNDAVNGAGTAQQKAQKKPEFTCSPQRRSHVRQKYDICAEWCEISCWGQP